MTKKPKKPTKKKAYLMQHMPTSINKLYADLKYFYDGLLGFPKLKSIFYNNLGYELNIKAPRSYNEKVIWKKVYDRNPLLTITADKYLVRFYLEDILGKVMAQKILIPLYHVTDRPDSIPFHRLPDSFMIKPNHGSRMHLAVNGNKNKRKEKIIKKCREWLKVNYGLYGHEWAYRNIQRKIIIEKLLIQKDGRLPMDYKFFCFHGKCKLIRASENRFCKNEHSGYFSLEWDLLPVSRNGFVSINKPFPRPSDLEEMIALSEKISEGFDSVRVDLYSFKENIFFGELTHYPTSGLAAFSPESFDFELGRHWKIEPGYWKKNPTKYLSTRFFENQI